MASKRKPGRSRSGTPWTEQDYRDAGWERLSVRTDAGARADLETLRARWGCTLGEALARALREAVERG